MTFYGMPIEQPPSRPLRKFAYRVYDGGIEHEVEAHEIYFYESGRVGFWNDGDDGERVLVLGIKAFQVRQLSTNRLSSAELAAEYWRARDGMAEANYDRDAEPIPRILHRFATLPHYDEGSP